MTAKQKRPRLRVGVRTYPKHCRLACARARNAMDTLFRNHGIPLDNPGAVALKGLLENGIPFDDKRCQTLFALLRRQPLPPNLQNNVSNNVPALENSTTNLPLNNSSSSFALRQFSDAADAPTSTPHLPVDDTETELAITPPDPTPPLPPPPQPPQPPTQSLQNHQYANALMQHESQSQQINLQLRHHQLRAQQSQRHHVATAPATQNQQLPRLPGLGLTGLSHKTAFGAQYSYPAQQQQQQHAPTPPLFQAPQWPSRGRPEHGVPYQQPNPHMSYNVTPNVYNGYGHSVLQQPVLQHQHNRAFSYEDNQRAILAQRLLIEQEAQRNFVRPTRATHAPEPRPVQNDFQSIQPMLDPAKYFTDTYSSPPAQKNSPDVNPPDLPSGSKQAPPASGAKPPTMPALRSVPAHAVPKRKRTPQKPVSAQPAPSSSISPIPLSKPDPRAVAANAAHPSSGTNSEASSTKTSKKNSRERRKNSKKVVEENSAQSSGHSTEATNEDQREGSTEEPNDNLTQDSTEKSSGSRAPEANGATGSTQIEEQLELRKPENIFQIPKKLLEQEKPKRKRKRSKKPVQNGKPASSDQNPPPANGTSTLDERVNGVKANQVFQIKAQLDAYRKLSRGMEPPMEVTIASGGARPISNQSQQNGTVFPSDLLSKGEYQTDGNSSARQVFKPSGVDPQRTTAECALQMLKEARARALQDVRGSQASQLNGTSLGGPLGQTGFSSSTPAGSATTPSSDAMMLNNLSSQSMSSKKVVPSVPDKPIPLPSLRVRRNERMYMYRREILENYSRNRSYRTSGNDDWKWPESKRKAAGSLRWTRPSSVPNGIPASASPQDPLMSTSNSIEKPQTPTPQPASLGVAELTITKKSASAPISVTAPQYNGRLFRELLVEREQRIDNRIRERLNELNSLPDDIPEDVRRYVIMEKKKINLLKLQRNARAHVTGAMRALFARGNSPCYAMQPKTLLYRRPTPTQWVWRQPGGGVSNVGDHLSVSARRHVQIMEQQHREEQERRRQRRQRATLLKLMQHREGIVAHRASKVALHKKLLKDLERYFRDKGREEERRRKKEQMERLKALRENNEDEYMKLLKNTKNKRLLQLLRQTDEYLQQIGAKLEQQKQAAREADELNMVSAQENDPTETDKGGDGEKKGDTDDEDLSAIAKRRNDYYTVTHAVREKVQQPSILVGGKLKPYQIEGLEWLVSLYNNNLNGILADEMGLGKTIQTLSLITYLVEFKNCQGPFLVIVPLSTISNWVRELEKWAPSLTKVVYRGDPTKRRRIYNGQMYGNAYNVLLTTYEFVVKDTKVLGKVPWKYIIIDEGHRMKNADCKLALTLGSKYKSKNRVLLTGTPLQNNLTELWALLNFLLPTIFSNSETFEQWFNAPFQAACLGGSQELDEEENLLVISRLHQVLRPFMLRRLKTDVECQLPEKVEEVLKCEMSAWQKVMYRQMRTRLAIATRGTKTTKAFNNIVMQLKKVANHPYLFYTDDDLHSLPSDFLIRSSGKFELLSHVLKKLQRTGHRVLMFSQMTSALDFLETFMMQIGIKYMRLDGTTKADDRQALLEDFNKPDSPYFCFLLSTRAGGLGLNLQTADTVIIFDSDWNPMMDLQAQDRAHRIGQTKEVRVLRLICSGTIEVQILERANRKLRMDAQVIQAGQFNNKSTDGDRQEMLKSILRENTGEDELANGEATSLEAVNRSLARTEEEFDIFEQMDAERLAEHKRNNRTALMIDEKEVPEWVLQPEVEQKSKEQLEAEYIEQHGRGQRKRKQVRYIDNLTEQEFTQVVEEDGDLEEAMEKKRRRIAEGGSEEETPASEEESEDETTKRRSRSKRTRRSRRNR